VSVLYVSISSDSVPEASSCNLLLPAPAAADTAIT